MDKLSKEDKEFVFNGGLLVSSTQNRNGEFILKECKKGQVWSNRLYFTKEEFLNRHIQMIENKGGKYIYFNFGKNN